MRIGELADKAGVNPKTIRYYEAIGLLPDPERQPSGYRRYSDEDVDRLRFVRTATRLGLSLSEISEILRLRERGERPCDYVVEVLNRQVADLGRRMAEMAALQQELIALKKVAATLPSDPACYCAVIEHGPRPERGLAPAGAEGLYPASRRPQARNGTEEIAGGG